MKLLLVVLEFLSAEIYKNREIRQEYFFVFVFVSLEEGDPRTMIF